MLKMIASFRQPKPCLQSVKHLSISASVLDDKLEDMKATKKKIVSVYFFTHSSHSVVHL